MTADEARMLTIDINELANIHIDRIYDDIKTQASKGYNHVCCIFRDDSRYALYNGIPKSCIDIIKTKLIDNGYKLEDGRYWFEFVINW